MTKHKKQNSKQNKRKQNHKVKFLTIKQIKVVTIKQIKVVRMEVNLHYFLMTFKDWILTNKHSKQ